MLASSSSGTTSPTLSAKLRIYTQSGISCCNSDTTILVQSLIEYPSIRYSDEQIFCINDIASCLCHLRTHLAIRALHMSLELMCTPDEKATMKKQSMQTVNVPEERLADFLAVNKPAMKLPNFCIPSRCFSVDACSSVK